MDEQVGYKKKSIWSTWLASISILIALSLLITGSLGVIAVGAPDLVVTRLEISPPNPEPGNQVEISAQVENRGYSDTQRFYVRLYVNGDRQDYKPIAFGLDAGEDDTVTFSWTAQPGQNELKIVVDDPFNRVTELNEDNNSLTRILTVSQPAVGPSATDLNVAVVSFEDKSNSGFANVSNGLADMLTEKLVNSGFNVLERQEIESILFERQLNPSNTSALAEASSLAGADAIVAGSVTNIDISKSRISLGFVSVTGATVRVNMTYRVISTYTGEILSADSATGKAEGQTSASFDMGALISSVSQVSSNVCVGGFRTNKNVYAQGEVITVGYLDNNAPSTFTIQFYNSLGSPIGPPMFSNYKSTVPSNNCVTWSWNPSPSLTPGNYSVKLYDSWSSLITTKNFTVSSGASPPAWVNRITFGTKEFSDSIVGEAVEKALSTASADLAGTLNNSASTLLAQRGKTSGDKNGGKKPQELKCRVVSLTGTNIVILGGVTGNCGKDEGVKEDDIFYLFSAESVKDPDTGELIEIIPKTEEPKGKVVIINIYENVCRGQLIGNFEAEEGDLAIQK